MLQVVLVAACFASSQAAYAGYGGGYSGPLATPVVNPSGFLQETPEVAAAKAAHFSEHAKVSSPAGYAPGPYNGAPAAPSWNPAPAAPTWNSAPSWNSPAPAAPAWNSAPAQPTWAAPSPAWSQHAAGPYASNPGVTPQGFLADTPEVAAAKQAHLSELAKVGSKGGPESYDDGSYRPEYDNPAPQSYAAPSWNSPAPAAPTWNSAPSWNAPAPAAPAWNSAPSPYASPVVTPQGFLQDTPEVAAAKAAHFSEVARAGTPAGPAHHGRYRRSAVLLPAAHAAPLVYSSPAVHYAAPAVHYTPLHVPSSWAYSVRSW